MPARTSATPWRTFSGVSRLIRPSSSSSPQSPQVDPSGRCVQRFETGSATVPPRFVRGFVPIGRILGVRYREPARQSGTGRSDHGREGLRRLRATGTSSSPPTSSSPASPSTCATGRCGRRTSRSSRSYDGAADASSGCCTPRASTAGRCRATARPSGRTPEGDPEMILEDLDFDGVDAAGDVPEPLAVRSLLRRPRALDGARARLQRLRRRAVLPVLPPPRAHRADPAHRRRRRGRRDRAGRRGRVPRHPAAGHPAAARTTPPTSTRCGPRRPATGLQVVHPHRRPAA